MANDGAKKMLVIEPHSPCYLHPSESPCVLITAKVFDEKNYDLRENAMQISLKAKNKLRRIDKTLIKPKIKEDDFIGYNAREMINSMICLWLLNVINKNYVLASAMRRQPRQCERISKGSMELLLLLKFTN